MVDEVSVQYSWNEDRSDSAPLEGAEFIDNDDRLYVFLDGPDTIETVLWFVSDSIDPGDLFNQEIRCPWDMVGTRESKPGWPAVGKNVSSFADGSNIVYAHAVFKDGTVEMVQAKFEVVDN